MRTQSWLLFCLSVFTLVNGFQSVETFKLGSFQTKVSGVQGSYLTVLSVSVGTEFVRSESRVQRNRSLVIRSVQVDPVFLVSRSCAPRAE